MEAAPAAETGEETGVGVVLALAEGLWAGGRNLALLRERKATRRNRSPIVMCLCWGT